MLALRVLIYLSEEATPAHTPHGYTVDPGQAKGALEVILSCIISEKTPCDDQPTISIPLKI